MEKVRLGIIGIGNMGSSHAKKVVEGKCPDFVLTAVADTNPAREDWAKKRLGEHVAFFHTAQEMLDSGLIDACIIAVPHYDHTKYAKYSFHVHISFLLLLHSIQPSSTITRPPTASSGTGQFS